MLPNEKIIGIILLSQIIVGVLGNALLLHFYIFNFITSNQKKPIDLILTHLILMNIMFLIFRGIPYIISSLGIMKVFDDTACKMMIYLGRVFLGLCLCSNCLLSTYQAITISTNYLVCGFLKARATKFIIPSLFLCWILNLLIHLSVPISKTAPRNYTFIRDRWRNSYCSFDIHASNILKNRIWTTFYDVVWCGLTIYTSVYSMVVMKSHHQQVFHIHNIKFTPRASPEIRAAKVILTLVSTFICFYLLSYTLFYLYMSSTVTNFWIMHACFILTGCFSTFSPFILIFSDTRISKVFYFTIGVQKFHFHSFHHYSKLNHNFLF